MRSLPLLLVCLACVFVFSSGQLLPIPPSSVLSEVWSTSWGNIENENQFFHAVDGSGSGAIYVCASVEGGSVVGSPNSAFQAPLEGGVDAVLLKYSSTGALLWMRQLASPANDRCYGLCSDLEGNVVVSLSSNGILNQLSPKGSADTILVKFDAAGNQLWSTNALATENDDWPATNAIQCQAGSVFIGHYLHSYYPNRVQVSRVNSTNGAIVWRQVWQSNENYDSLLSLHLDAHNYVYIGGVTRSSVPSQVDERTGRNVAGWNNAGERDGFVTVYDGVTGELVIHLPIQTAQWDAVHAIQSDANGVFYVGGLTFGSLHGQAFQSPGPNAFISKFQIDHNSNLVTRVWTRLTATGSSIRHFHVDGLGGLYAWSTYADTNECLNADCYSVDAYKLNKFDSNGNQLWSYQLPGRVYSSSLSSQGEMVSAGIFGCYNTPSLGALLPARSGYWDGFLRKHALNLNCNCTDLQNLIDSVQDLFDLAA